MGPGLVSLDIGHLLRGAVQTLGLHKGVQGADRIFQVIDHPGSGINQPDLLGSLRIFPGKEGDCLVHLFFLVAEIKDVAIGLGVVQDAICAGKCLDEAVVFEVLVHIEGVEELGIKAGEEHIHHDDDIDLVGTGQVAVGVLLVFDALLHILIIEIKVAQVVVGAVLFVIIGNDGLQGLFLLIGVFLVIRLFLGQIFLELRHIFVAFGRRRKETGDIQRLKAVIFIQPGLLRFLKKAVIRYGVVDGGSGQNRVELAPGGGCLMFCQDSLDNGLLRG